MALATGIDGGLGLGSRLAGGVAVLDSVFDGTAVTVGEVIVLAGCASPQAIRENAASDARNSVRVDLAIVPHRSAGRLNT
jgi:hypothetical protein